MSLFLYLILGLLLWLGVGALNLVLMQVPMWLSGGYTIKLDLKDGNEVALICFGPITTFTMLVVGACLLIIWPFIAAWTKLPVGMRSVLTRPITLSPARTKRPRIPGE